MSGVNWEKTLALEHKVARIISEQVRVGWAFDTEKARELVVRLDAKMSTIETQIRPLLKLHPSAKGNPVWKVFKADATYTKQVEDWLDELVEKDGTQAGRSLRDMSRSGDDTNRDLRVVCTSIGGPFTRIKWNELQLSQRDKLCQQLIRMGWKPSSYTEKGSPQLTPNKEPCPNLEKIPGDLGPKLSKYFLCAHRRSQIQGWIDNVRPDGRIEAQVRPNATNTGRGAHRIVANVPKAEEGVFLGREMRGLFISAPGKVLVGCDAAGLELRMLAHFMNDPEFTRELLEGDIHTVLWKEVDDLVPSRSVNKNCTYGLIYGASDRKLGETAGHGPNASHVGAEIRKRWMRRFPALAGLIDRVQRASKRGYLVGLDGRKIWMRRSPKNGKVLEHKALNTLLQCGGSIVMKTALCYQDKWIKERKLQSNQVCWYHDESTHECVIGIEEEVGELMRRAIVQAGRLYSLNCPMDGDPQCGRSWADIHG